MGLSRGCVCLIVLLLFTGGSLAQESFWIVRGESSEKSNWMSFAPSNEELSKQAVLLYGELPVSDKPVVVRQVLGQMYREIKNLRVLGRKPVPWRDGQGTLVSFSGRWEKKKVLGRAVIAPTEEATEVLLLVRHPRSDTRIVKNYELVRQGIDSFLEAKRAPKG